MSTDGILPSSPEPTLPEPPSQKVRLLTSWKLWVALLVLGVIGIAVTISMPILHRIRALRYFDNDSPMPKYIISEGHYDWPERYGSWANALRDIDEYEDVEATSESLIHVSSIPELRSLIVVAVAEPPVTAEATNSMPSFPRLERAHLFGECFTDECLARMFSEEPPLVDVELGETGAGRQMLETLASIKSISELAIASRTIVDQDYQGLASLWHLKTFMSSGAGDNCAEWLAQCPRLERVKLTFSTLSDRGLQRLCESPRLVAIHLEVAAVTSAGLQSLADVHQLHALKLVDCPNLTPQSIVDLPELPDLMFLTVSPDLLTRESVARLEMMPELWTIESVGPIEDPELWETLVKNFRLIEGTGSLSADEYWQHVRRGDLNYQPPTWEE